MSESQQAGGTGAEGGQPDGGWGPPPGYGQPVGPGYAPPPGYGQPAGPGYAPPPGYGAGPGYAPPPGYASAPGYPPAPGYPYAPARPASTGALPWGLGLLIFVPIPFISSIAASLAMILSARTAAQQVPSARENANRAGNWGLTYLIATLVLLGGHFSSLFVGYTSSHFFPFGFIILTWAAVSVVHVVFSIIGLVQASQGRRVSVTGLPVFR